MNSGHDKVYQSHSNRYHAPRPGGRVPFYRHRSTGRIQELPEQVAAQFPDLEQTFDETSTERTARLIRDQERTRLSQPHWLREVRDPTKWRLTLPRYKHGLTEIEQDLPAQVAEQFPDLEKVADESYEERIAREIAEALEAQGGEPGSPSEPGTPPEDGGDGNPVDPNAPESPVEPGDAVGDGPGEIDPEARQRGA